MPPPHARSPIELWAGPECSVIRIGESYVDQSELTGHAGRPGDLEQLASLGASAVRYPVLWERTAPAGAQSADWRWPDERLGALRELGLRPIVGLVHHGGGPRDTNLLDPLFARRLAGHARAVATRYPWVRDWTPVNEPLTTARFSCLYGHWHPHASDDRSFVAALLNQCRGVVLAMRAIREVIPNARLVQTDDLGKTHSTPRLAYQAAYENERRWLTWDILCGRVVDGHPLWEWLLAAGAGRRELEWFAREPCPPDVVGVNTYLSSERFLDERVDRFPSVDHGANGREAYADVLAARVLAAGPDGPAALLREAWERYRRPVAVTEVHNGCTRDEQLRWLDEVWRAACDLRREGAGIVAVTLWSVFGVTGWDALVRSDGGTYEPGAWDASVEPPRPTAVASMARSLAAGRPFDHPALDSPGWWRRDVRFRHEPFGEPSRAPVTAHRGRPLLVTGATGTLGRAFARICEERGLEFRLTSRQELDAAEPDDVAAVLDGLRPWAVVNTAGYVRVDEAEQDEARCRRENTLAPAVLARACASRGTALVTFSSDLVFDGSAGRAYLEHDAPAPLNAYGRSKVDGEAALLAACDGALVIRTGAFFGRWDEHNFVTRALNALAARAPVVAATDLVVSPTYIPDLVNGTLDLLIDGEAGFWHMANDGAVSWADLARQAAAASRLDASTLDARPAAECGFVATRPPAVPLATARGAKLPALDDALARYAR